jgi:RNA polymerase sigma-70 factor (ECF subfamily)
MDAFGRIVVLYESRLRTFIESRIGKHLRSRIEPEDILQETFLRALHVLDRFEWIGEVAFWGWISSLARITVDREARRHLAQKRDVSRDVALEEKELSVDGVSPSRILRRNERFERLKRGLKSLSPDYRRAVFLSQIRRLPTREIAQRLGRSPNATSMLLLRAYRQLRDAIGPTESLGLEHDASLENLETGRDE